MITSNIYKENEEFFSIPLYIDKRVLIPRNDTEVMVYELIKEINNLSSKNSNLEYNYIDVWTWSWAIPIAFIKNTPILPKNSFAIDISREALDVAKININKLKLENNIKLLNSDLLEILLNWENIYNNSNLIISANLPYIKNWDILNMDKEVLENEPHLALFWWEKTWFELYEKLINQIFQLKNTFKIKEITLFIEIWFDQYEYSKNYLDNLWLNYKYYKDLNWIWRCIKIYIKK